MNRGEEKEQEQGEDETTTVSDTEVEVERFVRAYRHLHADLQRAGYEVDPATLHADDAALRENVRLELSAPRDKYDASPTRIDMLAVYRRDDADGSSRVAPRIYVHFACFPAHVFKNLQMTAALNNLRQQRGVTSRDTVVFVTVKIVNTAKMEMSKQVLAVTHTQFEGTEGQYIIHFLLSELQFDLQAHVLVPPTRVLHSPREIKDKLARVACVLDPERELMVFNAKDPHMRRLFARPGDVIEALVTSETDVARPLYGIVKLPETAHVP